MWCMLDHLLGHSGHAETHMGAGVPDAPSPLDILKRRFALGEISQGQFEEMARVLSTVEASGYPAYYGQHR